MQCCATSLCGFLCSLIGTLIMPFKISLSLSLSLSLSIKPQSMAYSVVASKWSNGSFVCSFPLKLPLLLFFNVLYSLIIISQVDGFEESVVQVILCQISFLCCVHSHRFLLWENQSQSDSQPIDASRPRSQYQFALEQIKLTYRRWVP